MCSQDMVWGAQQPQQQAPLFSSWVAHVNEPAAQGGLLLRLACSPSPDAISTPLPPPFMFHSFKTHIFLWLYV
jgi:hypothetical protein